MYIYNLTKYTYIIHTKLVISLFTSITGWPLFWRFVAVLGGTQHVKCYSYHACTSATVSGGERMQQCMIQNHIFNIRLLLNTCMDTNMQQTVLGNFSLSRFFPLTFPWFLVKSLTFPWQLSNSLTFPAFPDKWSPCILALRVDVAFNVWKYNQQYYQNVASTCSNVRTVTRHRILPYRLCFASAGGWSVLGRVQLSTQFTADVQLLLIETLIALQLLLHWCLGSFQLIHRITQARQLRLSHMVSLLVATRHAYDNSTASNSRIYTVSQKKTPMRTIVHNFVKFLPIFTILWLAYSAGNL